MVERVHAGVLEALFGRPAVPALPDRGRAHRDGVEVARPALLKEKRACHVELALGAEHVRDIARGGEARAGLPAPALHVGDDPIEHLRAKRLGEQVEVERENPAGLRHRRDQAIGRDVALLEHRARPLEDEVVLVGILLSAQNGRDLAQEPRRVGQVRRPDQVFGRPAVGLARAVEGEPVAEAREAVEAGVAPDAVLRSRRQRLHEPAHQVVVVGQNLRVAVGRGRPSTGRSRRRQPTPGRRRRRGRGWARPSAARPARSGSRACPPSTCARSPPSRAENTLSGRTPERRPSTRAARRAGGSRSERPPSCRASPSRCFSGAG